MLVKKWSLSQQYKVKQKSMYRSIVKRNIKHLFMTLIQSFTAFLNRNQTYHVNCSFFFAIELLK